MSYSVVGQYLKGERRPGLKVINDRTGKFALRKRYRTEASAQRAADVLNRREAKREQKKNPTATTIRGWVKARAVKIVRNKRGQAVSVKIKT